MRLIGGEVYHFIFVDTFDYATCYIYCTIKYYEINAILLTECSKCRVVVVLTGGRLLPLREVAPAQPAGRVRPRHLVLSHRQPQAQHQLLRQDPALGGEGAVGVVSDTPLPPPVGGELPAAVHGVTPVLAELDRGHEVDGGSAREPECLQT